jgi:radical SAM superfamily enzyme YgiQ (UPF0313 family)
LSEGSVPLRLASPQVICDNLQELSELKDLGHRLYLAGENVLAFKTRYLLDLFRLIKSYLPGVNEFAMYGRANDVARKSDDQLAQLKAAGLDTVYVGVESGNPTILKDCKKGVTPQTIVTQLHRLDATGIHYGLSSILGLGGTSMWRENAIDTAKLYRQVSPKSIRVMTVTAWEGTPLAAAVLAGTFVIPSSKQILMEEQLFLKTLEGVSPCRFVGNHVSNPLPLVGDLPQDFPRLHETLAQAIESMGDANVGKEKILTENDW